MDEGLSRLRVFKGAYPERACRVPDQALARLVESAVRYDVEPLGNREEVFGPRSISTSTIGEFGNGRRFLTLVKLVPAWVHACPVRLEGEAVRVEVAGDVTCAGRVAVVPPSASHVVRLLVNGEVVVAQQAFELDGHADSGYASADDDHFL